MDWFYLPETAPLLPCAYAIENKANSGTDDRDTCDRNSDTVPMLRGLAYGDGFFTTMAVYEGHILWQSYHQARVINHLQALQLYLTDTHQQHLWQMVSRLATKTQHGIIKIIISRQTQALRGYAYSDLTTDNNSLVWVGVSTTPPLATAFADFLPLPLLSSLSLLSSPKLPALSSLADSVLLQQPPISAVCLNAQLACLPKPLAGLKSLNRLDSVLAAGELERYKKTNVKEKSDRNQVSEGLVRDLNNRWVEGVMSNVFYQLADNHDTPNTQWFTPPLTSTGVHGVMRQVIIDTLARTERPVQYRDLADTDLPKLKALFFCNAVRGVMPVQTLTMLDGQSTELSLKTYSVAN